MAGTVNGALDLTEADIDAEWFVGEPEPFPPDESPTARRTYTTDEALRMLRDVCQEPQ